MVSKVVETTIHKIEAKQPIENMYTARVPAVAVQHTGTITERIMAIVTLPIAITRGQKVNKVAVRDFTPWIVGITASIVSICALVYYFNNHDVQLYVDGIAHLRIGRSAFDSMTPGLAQLGSVWLPLQHMLFWPFIWNDYLWFSGLAGSFESMPCYVIACVFVFLITRRLTHDLWVSLIGTAVFMSNPNIVYLQTTPLGELLCMACYAWTCYVLLRWLETPTLRWLVHVAIATFFITMARYDGWPVFGAVWMIILLVSLRKREPASKVLAQLVLFTSISMVGIVLWLVWNKIIFGDPLYFQHGTYSSAMMQIPFMKAGQLYSYHSVWQSVRFYAIDTIQNIGIGISIASVIGLCVWIIQGWKKTETIFALILLVPFAFYVLSLYTGSAIIWIPGANPVNSHVFMYNTRYGAQMVLPCAIFCAILAHQLMRIPWFKYMVPALCILAIVVQVFILNIQGVVTLQEGQNTYDCSITNSQQAANYLHEHWNGGTILEDVYTTQFRDAVAAQIEFHNVIYEGSDRIWLRALANPGAYAEWILVASTNKDDLVNRHIDFESAAFLTQFRLVLTQPDGLRLYQRIGSYTMADRPALPKYVYPNLPCTKV